MKEKLIKFRDAAKSYANENLLLLIFIGINIINGFMLRAFTVKFAYNQIKPVMGDFVMCVYLGIICYAFKKPKNRFIYLLIMEIILTILTAGNSIYYTNYKSFMSFSLISTASQLGGVMDAVTKNILELKDLLFLWSIPALCVSYSLLKRRTRVYGSQQGERRKRGKNALMGFCIGLAVTAIFCLSLSPTAYSRLRKQWNREYVLGTFGMYTYQMSDLVSSTYSRVHMMFGYEEKRDAFNEFYSDDSGQIQSETKTRNEYTDIFKGKNVILIHGESIQQFTMDTYMNGEEITPNLNKLASEGLYFTNFYAQESVGTSSDSEFTIATSLMPASTGTVAINYWDRDYTSTQKLLKEKGYYVYSMHGNNGSYWNRMNLHMSLGYDKFYNYTTDFIIDETIGLGLSDKSFFRQAIPYIEEINSQHEKWFGAFLMLTNHTPFTDIERVSDFPVDFKYKRFNSDTGTYETVSAPFLEGMKLGSYIKSVHYADEALGQFIADLDEKGLLENAVIVLYGDHDAKVKEEEYEYYLNYDPFTDSVLTEEDEGYVPVDPFYYNLNRKVPFIIWSKGGEYEPARISKVMGMYDVQPTLGNMFGFENKYALGHDIFSIPEDQENVVIFPNGNFVTDTVYYDGQKNKYFDLNDYVNVMTQVPCNQVYKNDPIPTYSDERDGLFKFSKDETYCQESCDLRIDDGAVSDEYIEGYSAYAEERIDISNAIIYYDMINKSAQGFENEGVNTEGSEDQNTSVFAPPKDSKRRIRIEM